VAEAEDEGRRRRSSSKPGLPQPRRRRRRRRRRSRRGVFAVFQSKLRPVFALVPLRFTHRGHTI